MEEGREGGQERNERGGMKDDVTNPSPCPLLLSPPFQIPPHFPHLAVELWDGDTSSQP